MHLLDQWTLRILILFCQELLLTVVPGLGPVTTRQRFIIESNSLPLHI